jgi:DNA-binding LacI/PurR family transcriptional regulator
LGQGSEQHVANKVTIYDVATAAGVSISTVSLTLNTPERVSGATRAKILLAADELGFVPKADAVTRARRGVGRIGVIAPFSSYPSFGRRLNGVFAALRDEALEVVVFDQQSAATASSPLLASLPITRRLDGLIIMALPLDEAIAERLKRQRLPVVLVDAPRPDFDCVSTDNHGGGWLVATHLLAKGHRRFGFVGEWQQSHAYVSPSERRLAGLRDALATKGVSLPDDAVRLVNHGVEEACAAAHVLLDAAQPPTAIFAYDDLLAGGVLRAARRRGLAVPDDLAVVGFDDSDIAQALDLTTVRARFEESGRLGVRALLDLMQDRSAGGGHTTLWVELVERGTT